MPSVAGSGDDTSKDDLLNSIDGPFQLAEFLACKVRADPHDVRDLVEVPNHGQDADRDVVCRISLQFTPYGASVSCRPELMFGYGKGPS